MPDDAGPDLPQRLGPNVRVSSVRAVVNAASGSVGAHAAERLTKLTSQFGLDVEVASVAPSELTAAISAAIDAKPDLLILVAGDGTAALAAEMCGMDGPLLAPLPGGTMNMLPHALYGQRSWLDALRLTLSDGEPRTVSGGQVQGRAFYVAAILGAPALWAEAREALREKKLKLAFLRARRAFDRAFKGRLRFTLDGGVRQKAQALTLMCPLVSKALTDDVALEAAALDPHGAMDAFRLGFSTLVGKWRDDPTVTTRTCVTGRAWAHGRFAAILDGEPHRLDSPVSLQFKPQAFRALAPRLEATEGDAAREGERTGAAAAGGAAATPAAQSRR